LVDYYFEEETDKGDTVLTAFALDGRIIQLVKPSLRRLEGYRKAESDGSFQTKKNRLPDDDFPEPAVRNCKVSVGLVSFFSL